jgi:hypothetical protein
MISSVSEVLATFTSALRSRWELVFEHLALSHQVMVMQRSRRKPQFGGADRCFWILLSRVWDRWPKALVVAKPATVAAQVAYRMFDRWRQENFFKYLREEYALDALVEYAAVPDDPTREVPNPVWAALDAQLRQAHTHMDRLQAEYGLEALTNLEEQRRTMRGFKTAHGKLGQKIWNVWQRVLQLEKRRAAAPRRVPVQTFDARCLRFVPPSLTTTQNSLPVVANLSGTGLITR